MPPFVKGVHHLGGAHQNPDNRTSLSMLPRESKVFDSVSATTLFSGASGVGHYPKVDCLSNLVAQLHIALSVSLGFSLQIDRTPGQQRGTGRLFWPQRRLGRVTRACLNPKKRGHLFPFPTHPPPQRKKERRRGKT